MKYFVPIDRNTIVPNPRAGETISAFAVNKTFSFEIKGELPDFFINGDNVMINETTINHFTSIYKGTIHDENTLNKCFDMKIPVSVEINRKTYRHFPIPSHKYSYLNIKVECKYCHSSFKSNELLSDVYDDYYSDTICPKCKEIDCCVLEYESFNSDMVNKSK